ncbi:MAG: hypothetical protein SPI77_07475 [Corynebacterium sp.]|nr:hypothetical protein [Corynebacterium sp.]
MRRWITEGNLEAPIVIGHTYGVSPIPGLVALGALTDDDLKGLGRRYGLTEYTDLELAHEIVRRLENRGATEFDNP